MWLYCAQEDTKNGHEGEIDVFSSNILGSDFNHISLNATSRSYGCLANHSNMGPVGYVSAYNIPQLNDIDLSSKEVTATYDLPKSQGSYDVTFLSVNNHVFMRGRICCACEIG